MNRSSNEAAAPPEVAGRRSNDLDELYREHAPAGATLAFLLTGDAHLAEDLSQEAFIRTASAIWRIRDRSSFGAYLRRTIVNLCRAHFRKLRVERRVSALGVVTRDAEPPPDSDDRLIAALKTLPERQRAAVVLRYYEDLSEAQTAEILGCSARAVNSLVSRGRESLRTQIGDDDDRL